MLNTHLHAKKDNEKLAIELAIHLNIAIVARNLPRSLIKSNIVLFRSSWYEPDATLLSVRCYGFIDSTFSLFTYIGKIGSEILR